MVERARDAERTAEAEAERDHAHVLDARIGHQALDPTLSNDEQRADEQRKSAEQDQRELRDKAHAGGLDNAEKAKDSHHRRVQERA